MITRSRINHNRKKRKGLNVPESDVHGEPRYMKATENTSCILREPTRRPIGNFPSVSAFLCIGVLSLCPLYIILRHGANAPFCDELRIPPLVEALKNGRANLDLFWAPHNEHRILIPRILFAVTILVFGYNSKGLMLLSWIIAVVSVAFLILCWRRLFNPLTRWLWLTGVALTSLLMFSPIQSENWLWAFQLTFFCVNAAVVISLWAVSSDISLGKKIILVSLAACGASLSAAQGLMVWPAVLVTFFLSTDRSRKALFAGCFLLLVMVILFSLYFTNYPTHNVGQLDLKIAITQPRLVLFYFFGLLGSPLVFWLPTEQEAFFSCLLGSMLVFTYFYLAIRAVIQGQRKRAAPFIGLGIFVCSFGVVTTIGRSGFGFNRAVVSRYTTHEILLVIAVLALSYLLVSSRRRELKQSILCTAFLAIASMVLPSYNEVLHSRHPEKKARLQAKELIPFLLYFDPRADGVQNGPFYALLPIPHFKMFQSLLVYAQITNTPVKTDLHDSTNSDTVVGACRLATLPGCPGMAAEGVLTSARTLRVKYVFLRFKGQVKFIAATAVRPEEPTPTEETYRWQTCLPAVNTSRKGDALEMAVFTKERIRSYK